MLEQAEGHKHLVEFPWAALVGRAAVVMGAWSC